MSAADTFKACPAADREAPLMALECEARRIAVKANACREHGFDAMADITTGQQSAMLAALEVLRELHKEGAQ